MHCSLVVVVQIGILGILTGCSNELSSPSPAGPERVPIAEPSLILIEIRDAITEAPVTASVNLGGIHFYRSVSGVLGLRVPPGVYRGVVEAIGYHEFRVFLRVPEPERVLWMIPDTFDLTVFEEVSGILLRRRFVRWAHAPTLIIERAVLEPPLEGRTVAKALKSGRQMSVEDAQQLAAELGQILALLSVGQRFERVVHQTTAPGKHVQMERDGAITVGRYVGLTREGLTWPPRIEGSEIKAAMVLLNDATDAIIGVDEVGRSRRWQVRAHELGHALGSQHCVCEGRSIMHESGASEVTPLDSAMAKLRAKLAPGATLDGYAGRRR